jgi:two-component system, chemotaxis family, chemotaxis protein CheY
MSHILVVDDSSSMREMVSFTLKRAGHSVVSAPDGAEALKIAEEPSAEFDLVITDINMPVMDGFTLIRELRARKKYFYRPILVLSTESTPEKKSAGKSAGATGWIVKPFDPDQLLGVVGKVLPQ